ncbi:hypothetical protein [Synechococcus sp. MIT S1220]|uniref:hypothetical protein n=1 Tax=Synechococcus sp. MIT S1220 TaxID=3082549 RepID=UPI0039AF409D
MSDSYNDPQQQGAQAEGGRDGYRGEGGGRGGNRGGRSSGGREAGGFRIRLSDNEMRSARALQEAFNLRSTVAVLGFAVRTLGQMLEDGQLDELVAQHRSQAPRGGGRRGEGGRGRRGDDDRQGGGGRGSRPDPFARPAKPQPQETEAAAEAVPVADDPQPESAEVESADVIDAPSADEASSEDAKPTEA